MALALRLRRAAAISSSFLKDRPFSPIPSSPAPLSKPSFTPPLHGNPNPSSIPHSLIRSQSFRSSTPFSNRRTDFGDREGEINPDEILFEGCDYNHWLITMDFPKDPEPTREEKIEAFVQTCAKVVGSVEEAKKRIYSCSTTTYTGFNAVMTEEMSEKFKGLPGVVFILPDSYIDPVNKEYGGDKYENGVITPRPPPIQYQSRGRYERRPRFDGQREPFPARQGNPPQGNEISYTRQQNYGQSGQDGRGYGPPRGRDFAPSGDNRDFGQGQPRDRAQVGGRDPVPSHQREFGQGQQWNSAPQEQRNFSQGQGGDYRNADPSVSGDYRQRSAPGSSLNYSQGAGPGYSGNFGHSGDNRQGTGYGSGADFRQGSGSGYRNADPSVLGDYRHGSAPGSSLNYSQGAGPDYSGEYKQGPNFGHSGDNRQGTGSGYGADIRQGSGSGYGKNYPGSIEDQSEPWQGKY